MVVWTIGNTKAANTQESGRTLTYPYIQSLPILRKQASLTVQWLLLGHRVTFILQQKLVEFNNEWNTAHTYCRLVHATSHSLLISLTGNFV